MEKKWFYGEIMVWNPLNQWFGLPETYGIWLVISLIYMMFWASFDLLQDRLLWSIKCKRGDSAFKRNWRNIWKYFFPTMTIFITGLLCWQGAGASLKFLIYSWGFQINGMEDLLYYLLQGKIPPKKLPWLPPWLNSRRKILISVAGFLLFILTFLEIYIH